MGVLGVGGESNRIAHRWSCQGCIASFAKLGFNPPPLLIIYMIMFSSKPAVVKHSNQIFEFYLNL